MTYTMMTIRTTKEVLALPVPNNFLVRTTVSHPMRKTREYTPNYLHIIRGESRRLENIRINLNLRLMSYLVLMVH